MEKLTTCIWFNDNAQEAAKFYTSLFDNSRLGEVATYSEASAKMSGRPVGSVLTVVFHLEGQEFMALNGGPIFSPTPAISFFVSCESEEEIDRLFAQFSLNGAVLMPLSKYPFSEKFGWINDRFGVSWQLNLAPEAQKIRNALLFTRDKAGRAQEAIDFYTSVFKNSRVVKVVRYPAGMHEPEGWVMHAAFVINGKEFVAMDSGGPHEFGFTEGTSFVCHCETQQELDYLWDALSAGGQPGQCGWLVDKFGVSWQVVPALLGKLMSDSSRSGRVMDSLLTMTKLDIATLTRAAE